MTIIYVPEATQIYHDRRNDVSFILLYLVRAQSYVFGGYSLKSSLVGPFGYLGKERTSRVY